MSVELNLAPDALKRRLPSKEGEKLLRLALFDNTLELLTRDGSPQSLVHRRNAMAQSLRERRRKGVIPVFITLGWFLFALALSIEDAFGRIGDNQTAHNLALGLLMGWLAVFVLATIVDRNPIGADPIRRKLNNFLEDVLTALLDPASRANYLRQSNRREHDLVWTNSLDADTFSREGFFVRFAGQGRVRYHYGVAHSISYGMETAYIAVRGRDWLQNPTLARHTFVWGSANDHGLLWFDARMIWDMLVATVVVGGTVFGAFILSCKSHPLLILVAARVYPIHTNDEGSTYISPQLVFTPTVGLGCRSGGYLVYFVLAFSNCVLEMSIWWMIPQGTDTGHWLRIHRVRSSLPQITTPLQRRLDRADSDRWGKIISEAKYYAQQSLAWWDRKTLRDRIEILFLRPCDVVNSTWLAYIICAQTFGADQNCACKSSDWGPYGVSTTF
ncbi:MAG: hypothetical protein Q9174_003611 [Haloplaca sp. 1 TL-2023]